MRIKYSSIALAMYSVLVLTGFAQAQNDGVYIIYDSSNSMWGELPDGSRKYEAARNAMRELTARDFGSRDIALRMYGHRRKDDCTDSELLVDWAKPAVAGDKIIAAMTSARPTGRTPIDSSLRAALMDFGDRNGTIILVSDGIESCDADPCALVREWRDRQVEIKVHVVGLGLRSEERKAMQCIADASGTVYHDAFSADQLVAGLDSALSTAIGAGNDPGPENPNPQSTVPQLTLTVLTADGLQQKGRSVFTPVQGGDPIDVETSSIYRLPPGDYDAKGGVVTLDGSVYSPIKQTVTVQDNGLTKVVLEDAVRPPEVSAHFTMAGVDIRDSVVQVYQDGRLIGSFHGDESAFLPEGSFEFRARLAGTSQDIRITESFEAGDVKKIAFNARSEVKLIVRLTMIATGEQLLSKPNLLLFQSGELKHQINSRSGGLVFPGQYTINANDSINEYKADIQVSSESEQVVDIALPSAAVTVRYVDVDGQPEKPKRVFVYPESGRRGVTRRSDQPIGLLPGTYTIAGHPARAGYPDTTITVVAGEQHTVTLRANR